MKLALFLCLLTLVACQSAQLGPDSGDELPVVPDGLNVDEVMDAWHAAAAEVNAELYLGYMSSDSVFLGTDPGERWSKAEFSAYVEHYFTDLKRGWEYLPSQRHVTYSPDSKIAWLDERLENKGYGVLRGTGVLQLERAGWRILHYSMTFAVPNGKVQEMVTLLGLVEPVQAGGS